jgi:N-methylhydantoinase B
VDPITLEVLWSRLISAVNEQAAALVRTSFTSVVRESGDLSAGVFDPRGWMIAQAVTGTPGHINSMATCIHHFLKVYPPEALRPGDVLVTNDPWQTAGQLHDLTLITPAFRRGRLVAFFGNTCHAVDIGGRGLSADARQVFEEGITIPITKLYDGGRPNRELFQILRANTRAPDQVAGDIHAQVVANQVGARQLLDCMAEFGLEDILGLADAIVTRSERAMRDAIRTIPDGAYRYTLWHDGFDEPIKIQTQVRVAGSDIHVDFTGTSPQSQRGINVVFNYTHAYVTYAVKCLISPDIPNNEGSFRPVRVTAPPGCILDARHPAAVAGRHLVGHFLPGAIFAALAPAIPDRVMAESSAGLWNTNISGEAPPPGGPFTYVWFSAGGMGARPTKDGLSATAFPSGIGGVPVEVIESLSPVLMERRELRPDSGGPGKFRGGCGQTMILRFRTAKPVLYSPLYDRVRFPAFGLLGGWPGAKGECWLNGRDILHPKEQRMLPPGAQVTLRLPGGGGYGPPLEREVRRVVADVEAGLVSTGQAREAYGVVFDPATGAVDQAATVAWRDALARTANTGKGEGS